MTDWHPNTEPTTEAGRRLLTRLMTRGSGSNEPFEAAIAAIEAEAVAAERERIAEQAMERNRDIPLGLGA